MKLQGKNILIISPEPWTHIHVSKHHYAIELAEMGNQVYFLNPPGSGYSLGDSGYHNLKTIHYYGFLPGLYRMPHFIRVWNQRRVLNKIIELAGVKFDIVWSFDNSVFYDFGSFGEDVYKISHIVDLGQNFQTKRAAKSANLCLGVIPEIVSRLKLYNSNSHLIKHGVKISDCNKHIHLPGRNGFKALYFGNMAMPDLDWELMSLAVSDNPLVDFIFIGQHPEIVENKLGSKENVFNLDPVPSQDLFCYMKASDVLMLFYKSSYFQKYASPHKMMEYLSSGRPIIAPVMNDYLEIKHLLMMCKDRNEWLEKIKDISTNSSILEADKLSYQREQFVKDHSYIHQINKIENLIITG